MLGLVEPGALLVALEMLFMPVETALREELAPLGAVEAARVVQGLEVMQARQLEAQGQVKAGDLEVMEELHKVAGAQAVRMEAEVGVDTGLAQTNLAV